MKPYINSPNKAIGGTARTRRSSWSFQRREIARLKRDDRRNRRATDKLALAKET